MQTNQTGQSEHVKDSEISQVEESAIPQDDTWTFCDIADATFKKKLSQKLHFLSRSIRLALLIALALHFFTAGFVPSASMKPTLHVKDYVIYQKTNHVSRGDAILFRHPFTNESYVKRIVGLPGETVAIENGIVFIDGKELTEDYLLEPFTDSMEAYTIAPNSYFVMGDNRNDSEDSRIFGAIKASSVKGRAVFILLPFHRLGMV